jgi:CRP/FNR family cyclic AMP-dependent transcriptional regulator
MPCDPAELKHVPLFALLDEDELAVLSAQVDLRKFAARQRIYKTGEPGKHAHVFMCGHVQVTTVDENNQEVVVDKLGHGEFFGFASLLDQTPHQTTALAIEETECVEISREAIAILLQQKPLAGMDMLTVLGRQFHASQQLVRIRASRNANDLIEESPRSASASPTPSPASEAHGPSSSFSQSF